MANFLSLRFELRVLIYKYLLIESIQPTARKYPRNIPICKALSHSSDSIVSAKEAYLFHLSSNNIIFDNSRAACLWLQHISPYFDTDKEQPPHLTFDLRHDCKRSVGNT